MDIVFKALRINHNKVGSPCRPSTRHGSSHQLSTRHQLGIVGKQGKILTNNPQNGIYRNIQKLFEKRKSPDSALHMHYDLDGSCATDTRKIKKIPSQPLPLPGERGREREGGSWAGCQCSQVVGRDVSVSNLWESCDQVYFFDRAWISYPAVLGASSPISNEI